MGAAVAAGAVLPHRFGTIRRADGQAQATYDGHPLYTYAGNAAAGQVKGNARGGISGRQHARNGPLFEIA